MSKVILNKPLLVKDVPTFVNQLHELNHRYWMVSYRDGEHTSLWYLELDLHATHDDASHQVKAWLIGPSYFALTETLFQVIAVEETWTPITLEQFNMLVSLNTER